MKFDRKMLTLYAVTDRAWTNGRPLAVDVEAALRGGVTLLQLREKELSKKEIADEARELLPLCRRYGVPLIINDHPEVAAEVGADGVHVGQSDESPAEIRRQPHRRHDGALGRRSRRRGGRRSRLSRRRRDLPDVHEDRHAPRLARNARRDMPRRLDPRRRDRRR